MDTPHPGPRRHLSPHIASAIRRAKEDSGLSWHQLAVEVGISRAHLNYLGNGKRIPSRVVAKKLIEKLDLDRDVADELLLAAAPMWWERNRQPQGPT